ncbi:MAG TPA: CBS domain-containing protein [Candidatus Binataceae bacterium]|nr:CBS domain-containing protein [Candidatus Binataceae bacterium]
MIVTELMTPNPLMVTPRDSLELARAKMEAGKFRQLPVVDQGQLVGIVTDRDLRRHIGQLAHTRVDAVMTAHPYSVHPTTPVEEAAELLIVNKFGSLPVTDENGKLVGIITATDMLRALTAILGAASDGSSRIDLDVKGSGEISAATGLVQTICSLRGIGTYRRGNSESEILYMRVPSASAQLAASTLKEYGFRVLAVHA